MYAIVEIAGQQFKVAQDQKVYVHRLQEAEGSKVTFNNVMLLDNKGTVTIGAPAIEGAAVTAKILKHLKGDKVIVFKKKRRKGYIKKNGHRQYLSEIVIESIAASGAKKTTPKAKKEEAPKKEVAKAAPKAKALEKVKAAPKAKKEEAPKKEVVKATPKAKAASPKKTVKKEASSKDLSTMTVAELKALAKKQGLSGYTSLKKAELITALTK